MVNVRTKGQTGERDVQAIFNNVIDRVRKDLGLPELVQIDKPFQRNQNQSAVGGSDLTNPYGLCIEVKNQAQLSVNTWWNQCIAAAERPTTGGMPILIYKIARKGWHIMMEVNVPLGENSPYSTTVRATFKQDELEQWFTAFAYNFYSTHGKL